MGTCPCWGPQLMAGHRLPHSRGATPWGSRCHPSCRRLVVPLPDLAPMLNLAKNDPRPPAEPRWGAGSGPGVGWVPGEGWHHPPCFFPPCAGRRRGGAREGHRPHPEGPDPLHAPGGRCGAEGGPGVGAEGLHSLPMASPARCPLQALLAPLGLCLWHPLPCHLARARSQKLQGWLCGGPQ